MISCDDGVNVRCDLMHDFMLMIPCDDDVNGRCDEHVQVDMISCDGDVNERWISCDDCCIRQSNRVCDG